jgi:hypothetical protein
MDRKPRQKEYLLAVYKTSDLTPVGLFVNSGHVSSVLGVDQGNVMKVADGVFFSTGDFIIVKVGYDNSPVSNDYLVRGLPIAKERQAKSLIANLNVHNLDLEKIKAIQKILEE